MTATEPVEHGGRAALFRQGLITAVVGAVVFVLGSALASVVPPVTSGGRFFALVFAPPLALLVWAVIAAFGLPLAGGGDQRLVWLAIGTAVGVAAVSALVQIGLADGVMLLIVATCKGLTLGGAASIGALIGLWDSRRRRHTSQGPARSEGRRDTSRQSAVQPRSGARSGTTQAKERGGHPFVVASALALAAGTVLTVCLPLEGFLVYFSISTAAEPPTPAEIARYEWTAAGALLLLAAAIVVSAIRRRGGLVVLSTVALLFAVVVAYVFAVPRERFLPEPPPDVVYDGPVCFGTSGDCPGG